MGFLLKITTVFTFIVHFGVASPYQARAYTHRISEIKGNILNGLGKKEFIEIQGLEQITPGRPATVTAGTIPMAGLILLFIKSSRNGRAAAIFGICRLQNQKMNDAGFFTIGGADVIDKSMEWSSGGCRYAPMTTTVSSVIDLFLPTQKRMVNPFSLMLIQSSGTRSQSESDLSEIQLSRYKTTEVEITPTLELIISNALVDMVVFHPMSDEDKCIIFDRIAPTLSSKSRYILRDYSHLRVTVATEANDVTLPTTTTVTPGHRHRHRHGQQKSKPTPSSLKPKAGGLSGWLVKTPNVPSTSTAVVMDDEVVIIPSACYPPGDEGEQPEDLQLSISRCTESMDAFIPESFKVTIQSPNAENKCHCGVRIFPEDLASNIHSACDSYTDGDNTEKGDTGEECAVKILTKSINTELSYFSNDKLLTDSAMDMSTYLDPEQQGDINIKTSTIFKKLLEMQSASGIASMELDPNEPTPAEQLEWNAMMTILKRDHQDTMPITWISDNKLSLIKWLQFIVRDEGPTMRCRICYKHHGDAAMNSRWEPSFATPEGQQITRASQMQRAIKQHLTKSSWHAQLTATKANIDQQCLKKRLAEMELKALKKLSLEQQKTAQMMTTVYAESVMTVPFAHHSTQVSLMEMYGSDMGYHHKDKNTPPKFLAHISEEMHLTMLLHMTRTDKPVSLMFDTAVDSVGHDFLIVQIQTLENNYPVNYLYRLKRMGVDSTARGYLRILKGLFDEDSKRFKDKGLPDLWEFLKRNLISIATDGVAVFSGADNGVGVLLSEALWEDKLKLYRIHCMPHRLHLAGRHVVDAIDKLQEFELTVKGIATFYNNQNAKNLAHLTELAQVERWNHLYRLTYTFDTRWATNGDLCLSRLRKNMPLLLLDLPAIAADEVTFKAETRAKATGLFKNLSDVNFHLILHLMSDIVENLRFFSADFQKVIGSIVGKESTRRNMFYTFSSMLHDSPTQKHLGHFIKNLECKTDGLGAFRPCKSIRTIDRSISFRWTYEKILRDKTKENHKVILNKKIRRGGEQLRFSDLRNEIVNELLEQIERYFPEGTLEMFEPFYPRHFKLDEMLERRFHLNEVQKLADRFGFDSDVISTEYQDFMYKLASSEFMAKTSMSPGIFWGDVLNSGLAIEMGENINKLIKVTMAISPSSAESERGFSKTKHIKSSRRTRMLDTTLEDLLRVSLNGPKNIFEFPSAKYAATWKGQQTGDPRNFGGGHRRSHPKRKNKDPVCQVPTKKIFTTEPEMQVLRAVTSTANPIAEGNINFMNDVELSQLEYEIEVLANPEGYEAIFQDDDIIDPPINNQNDVVQSNMF